MKLGVHLFVHCGLMLSYLLTMYTVSFVVTARGYVGVVPTFRMSLLPPSSGISSTLTFPQNTNIHLPDYMTLDSQRPLL